MIKHENINIKRIEHGYGTKSYPRLMLIRLNIKWILSLVIAL
jgi:hypothetical protein